MESFVLCFLLLLQLVPLSDAGCAGPPALCCANKNNSCYRGCFCDEACVKLGDCCSDYVSTCTQHFQTVVLQLQAAVSFPNNQNAAVVSESISQFLSQTFIQQNCKNCTIEMIYTKLV
ncbi:somatomedin-B and thrombospondin type-1 domain-containing protein [Betta splendens]|uniref:Somatomedin-B and thrombospondin type-1 domain-containing protein n=1 Tax=Betta splendens TaxID=158456 RepID=A0A8M1H6K4_BETSP|nr:somatomedin-B and thrombospondin type-1 domain-containing protein [Betta splendens]